jgi:putative ABC transport system substrate-binding protein
MTTRRDALLALPLLCGAPSLRGQKPSAIPPKRLGIISLGADSPTPPPQRPLYLALRQRGWILGENLLREPAYADGKPERLAGLAEELVRKRVDVILSLEDAPTVAAARATRTIPIVFTLAQFPVELGLVDSYARPGHNVTGQTFFAGVEVAFKRLVFLREIAPNSKRLSYLIPNEAPPQTDE